MTHATQHEFRISKYNKNSTETNLLLDDWTSISDIGKVFGGRLLTYSEYEQKENQYLLFISKVCMKLNITKMRVICLENPFNLCSYNDEAVLDSIDKIIDVARGCLREKYWCKLDSDILSYHFGYDFYLYVCSPLTFKDVRDLAYSCGLFVEVKSSPYKVTAGRDTGQGVSSIVPSEIE